MKAVMNEKCEKCGKEGLLTQVDEVFHFPCKCHSKDHVIRHYLCDSCKEGFHVSPNRRFDVILSRKSFCLILKAHEKYYQKFGCVRLDENTMKPKFIFNKNKGKLELHLHCTYKVLTYIEELYDQWTTDHPNSCPKDQVAADTQAKD